MKIYDLFEARRNPSKNPKTSLNDQLQAYYDENGEDTFVSFTSVDKLGINPKSKYDTPLGIYTYPLSYVLREIGEYDSPKHVLPFAGDAPFVNVFTADSASVKHLADIDMTDFRRHIVELKLAFPEHVSFIDSSVDSSEFQALHRSGGGRLWYVTKVLAERLSKGTSTKPPVMWNKIFRTIGIDGMVDAYGDGIIHHNEPTQAVFFRRVGIIKNEARIYNKYSPDAVEASERIGKDKKSKSNKFASIFKQYLTTGSKDYIGFLKALGPNRLNNGYIPQKVLNELTMQDAISGLYDGDDIDELDKIEFISNFIASVPGKRWPACEKYLSTKPFADTAVRYAINNLGAKFELAEKNILSHANAALLFMYVDQARNAPWPAAADRLANDPTAKMWWAAYRKKFKISVLKPNSKSASLK